MREQVPPPGGRVTTVTCAVPGLAISAAVIAACTCVLPMNVVVRFEPFHFTCEVATKFEPFTVRVKAEPP